MKSDGHVPLKDIDWSPQRAHGSNLQGVRTRRSAGTPFSANLEAKRWHRPLFVQQRNKILENRLKTDPKGTLHN